MTERTSQFERLEFRTTEERSKFWRLAYRTWNTIQSLSTSTTARDLWQWRCLPADSTWRTFAESLDVADQAKLRHVSGIICQFLDPNKPLSEIVDPEFKIEEIRDAKGMNPKTVVLFSAGFQGVGFEQE